MRVKRIFNLGMVLMLLVTSFAVSQPVAAKAPVKFIPRIAPGAQTVEGEVVVAFANSQDKNLVEKIEQAVETANTAGGEVTRLSLDGSAVIQVAGDTTAALAELNAQSDVLYAEPNYVYEAPESEAASGETGDTNYSDFIFTSVTPSVNTNGKSVMAVPKTSIQSMMAAGTYPSDVYLTSNQAWFNMGANIVWPNTTTSANVCEVDTGVDFNHPDLSSVAKVKVGKKIKTVVSSSIIQGYDFVNADAVPMDDHGHGTHVAGIMVSRANNALGVSGVSTGKVVAVKALDAQGLGTNFDIAKAIQYCADRTDIRIINLSLAGSAPSTAIKDALLYATTPTTQTVPSGTFLGLPGKGKLVVAAAGNKNSTAEYYPAGYANDADFYSADPLTGFTRILAVGATGDVLVVGEEMNYSCKADISNYGAWVNISAPGADVLSTTPYDVPFHENYYGHLNTRYDYMSGTSMSAAFVSASAARRMGYKPLETSQQVAAALLATSDDLDDTCTPIQMLQAKKVNVAAVMDRAGLSVSVFDAATGIPLNGATVSANYLNAGVAASSTAVISPEAFKDTLGLELDPNRIFTFYKNTTDILNIPTVDTLGNPIFNYTANVYKVGYTAGYQPAFQQDVLPSLTAGKFAVLTNGAVPPLSADFNVVLGWHVWQQPGYKEVVGPFDLDLYVWLPGSPFVDPGQQFPFIVGFGGDAFGLVEGDSYGTLNASPFARLKREGGYVDGGPTIESTMILKRAAHGTVLANAALPYYAGTYTVLATDYNQTIDHDSDGCGDNYGYNYTANPAPCGGTQGIPLLGAYYTPYVYVWKDGAVKYFLDGSNNYGPYPAADACNKHWWKGFAMTSAVSGNLVPTYTTFDTCDNGAAFGFIPYAAVSDPNNDRITISGLGK